jgi:hypothetical protein
MDIIRVDESADHMPSRTAVISILGIGAAGLLVVAVCGLIGVFMIRRLTDRTMSIPPALTQAGVTRGESFLIKSVFLSDAAVGTVTDMILNPLPDARLGISGTRGALFLKADATVHSQVAFSSSPGFVQFVDVEADGVWEFLNRGGGGWQDASLIDNTGRLVWTCGGMPGVDDMSAGDLDGDGVLDFVVGYNGSGGVRRLDKSGSQKWQVPDGNVWHVEVVDADGDGKPEIVHSNAGGDITVRDQTGRLLHRSTPGAYFSDFSLCRWPNQEGRKYPISAEDDKVWIFDYDGKTIARYDAPDAGTLGHAFGTFVRLRDGDLPILAVVVAFQTWNMSILYVYGPDKKLAYQEVIADTCMSVLALPREGLEIEDLLVGGTGKVWKFTAAEQTAMGDPATVRQLPSEGAGGISPGTPDK